MQSEMNVQEQQNVSRDTVITQIKFEVYLYYVLKSRMHLL